MPLYCSCQGGLPGSIPIKIKGDADYQFACAGSPLMSPSTSFSLQCLAAFGWSDFFLGTTEKGRDPVETLPFTAMSADFILVAYFFEALPYWFC